jgi:hypothetical protein
VQPLCAGGDEMFGLADGVIAIIYPAVVPTLDEPDTFALHQVYCRYDVHFRNPSIR